MMLSPGPEVIPSGCTLRDRLKCGPERRRIPPPVTHEHLCRWALATRTPPWRGRGRPLMASGHPRRSMAIHGDPWRSMAIHGDPWSTTPATSRSPLGMLIGTWPSLGSRDRCGTPRLQIRSKCPSSMLIRQLRSVVRTPQHGVAEGLGAAVAAKSGPSTRASRQPSDAGHPARGGDATGQLCNPWACAAMAWRVGAAMAEKVPAVPEVDRWRGLLTDLAAGRTGR
jgi:hypothetical protein